MSTYGKGFFDPCWRVIYPTPDQGEPVQDHEHILSADCPCNPTVESYVDARLVLENLADDVARHPLSQAFWEKLLAAGEMHDRKQADYGRSNDPFHNVKQSAQWGVEPWVGALMRLDDKVGRLRNLARDGGALVNESIEDSLMDIAVYALISLVLREEEVELETLAREAVAHARATRAAHVTALQAA